MKERKRFEFHRADGFHLGVAMMPRYVWDEFMGHTVEVGLGWWTFHVWIPSGGIS